MLRYIFAGLILLAVGVSGWIYASLTTRSHPVDDAALCWTGAYQFADGRNMVMVAWDDGGTLELFLEDGTRTLLVKSGADRFSNEAISVRRPDCAHATAWVKIAGLGNRRASKLTFDERLLNVKSGGVLLRVKVVLPRTPFKRLVVWVGGSNDDGEIDRTYWQYTLPLNGIGSVLLDKRGTGGSTGNVSANFQIRAADVRETAKVVRATHPDPGIEIGLHGASQGGWVAPLAALTSDVDFVIVSYGLAEGVTAEDRDEMAAYVHKAGYGADALAELRNLTNITARIVKSRWQDGWEELSAWRAKHGHNAWVSALPTTSYTGFLLSIPDVVTAPIGRWIGPLLDKGVSFDYEPLPTLRSLEIPQLWLLGGSDVSAPSAATIRILKHLQGLGHDIDLVVFPRAGHGLMEPWPERKSERLAPGYRETVVQWVRTRQLPALTDAEIYTATAIND